MSPTLPDRIKIPGAVWAGFRMIGAHPAEVVRRAQLPVAILGERAEVTTGQFFALWQAASELTGDPAAGIRIATQLEAAVMPPAFLAAYHARDYRDALHRVARFKQLCAPEQLDVSEKDLVAAIEIEWIHAESAPPPALVDATMASLLELGRRGTQQPLKAREVELARPRSGAKAHEVYFGCKVRFGARKNRLSLNRSDLNRPFGSYNAELLDMLAPELNRALKERRRSITEKVTWVLKGRMSAGSLDIRSVASELGMSERTLQRRIGDEGTSFQRLVSEARRERAREYLADASLDIKEVAFLLGYSDQNSFYRAFRQWERQTPSSWRAAKREPTRRTARR